MRKELSSPRKQQPRRDECKHRYHRERTRHYRPCARNQRAALRDRSRLDWHRTTRQARQDTRAGGSARGCWDAEYRGHAAAVMYLALTMALTPNPFSHSWERGLLNSVPKDNSQVVIRLVRSTEGRMEFQASGLTSSAVVKIARASKDEISWRHLFVVHVGDENGAVSKSQPPIFGAYHIRNNALIFTPQFPLEPGLSYRATFYPV